MGKTKSHRFYFEEIILIYSRQDHLKSFSCVRLLFWFMRQYCLVYFILCYFILITELVRFLWDAGQAVVLQVCFNYEIYVMPHMHWPKLYNHPHAVAYKYHISAIWNNLLRIVELVQHVLSNLRFADRQKTFAFVPGWFHLMLQ